MSGSGKIRVLIVDDVMEARDNVAKLLRFEPGVEIVGVADGGQEGYRPGVSTRAISY